jgi:DNA-directed RNA polymerase I, II, and III subunit RPABC2
MSDYEASDYNSESDGSDSEIETTQPQKKITIKIGSNDKSIPKVSTNIDDYENSDSDISEVEDDLEEEEEPQIGGVDDFDSDEDEEEDNKEADEESDNDDDEGEKQEKIASSKKTKNPAKKPVQIDLENEDDDDDNYDDSYLQKFDSELTKNYINEFHPECLIHNYDEISKLTVVVRDSNNIIIDSLHRTIPFLTKYEKARILGQRAKQIETGARPFVNVPENVIDSYIIAELELQQKRIPFIIRRPIPGGACEYWNLKDLEVISF